MNAWSYGYGSSRGRARDRSSAATNDRIKIRVAAPAVDGKANVALIRFLAREFGVKQVQVRLADGARTPYLDPRGQAGRHRRSRQAAGVVDRNGCDPETGAGLG